MLMEQSMSALCRYFSSACVLAVGFLGAFACGRSEDVVIGLRSVGDGVSGGAATGGESGMGGQSTDASVAPPMDAGLGGSAPSDAGLMPFADAGFSCRIESPAPIHQYTFEDQGTVVTDARGGAHGTLIGTATQTGSGLLDLDALGYVDLPNGLISSLPHLTVAVWFEWDSGAAFQRIFDFGTTTLGEDPDPEASYRGDSYIALTSSFNSGQITYLANAPGHDETSWLPAAADVVRATQDVPHFAAVVFENGRRISLFLDGQTIATSETTLTLAEIDDVNVWLGRSQWDSDNAFNGIYDELRIYDVPLCEEALDALYAEGPVPNPLG
jgi:hypothetical protein